MSHASNTAIVRVYGRLLAYVRPHALLIVVALLAAVLHALADASIPYGTEQVVNQLRGDGSASAWARYIPLLIVVVFSVRACMDFLTVYLLSRVGRSAIRDLRRDLFNHYLRLPTRFYDSGSTGELLSKLTYNTEQVADAISNAIVVLLRDSLTIVLMIFVMIDLSFQLALLVAVVAPTIGVLVAYLSRVFRRYSARIQNSMGDVTKIAEQSLAGHRIVKVFQGEAQEAQSFAGSNRQNFRLNVRLVASRAMGEALTQYIVALGVAAIIYAAFEGWLGAEITPGVFVAFLGALAQMLAPLKRLININAAIQRGIAAAASVFEVLDLATEPDSGRVTCTRAEGVVEYRNVSFGYDREKGRVLHDVNLTIGAGSSVAFVGRSGSGKTSLVGLLPRFYDVDQGAITLDGVDIRDYRLSDLRNQIAFVSQDIVLFDDSIANNIAYGSLSRANRADIERAAEAAHVREFADTFPHGLDTQVGERGALLSGGQRQRVAIARAILKDAPVLILDEATSALDTESERKIQDALRELMRDRTTLVVAHRLSTIEGVDRIVVLNEGEIVESGSHAELLALNGYYAALYKMQFAE
jgi:ATP-binding cassette, subfamily B, bacterial MsbA